MAHQLDRLKAALADRYAIERELGAGGMATVYLTTDLERGRKVALKVLSPEVAAALGPKRFLREIAITARLTHPHILPLLDSGEVDGFMYYVMPYVEGESLRDRLTRERQLPFEDAVQITTEIAEALAFAHSRDVVHRDVKPDNVLLHEGKAVIADFGVARAITEAGGERLTATGMIVGTPEYMSPEQARGDASVDGRADIYALGCVVFEMLGGAPPFTGPTAQAVLGRKLSDPVPSLRAVRETVPEAFEHVLSRALAREPADRFATAAELVEALEDPATITPVRVRVADRKDESRRHWAVGAAMALAAAIAFAIWPRDRGAGEFAVAREDALAARAVSDACAPGSAAWSAGRPRAAVAAFESVELDSAGSFSAPCLSQYAQSLHLIEEYERELAVAELAAGAFPANTSFWHARFRALAALDRLDDALKMITDSLAPGVMAFDAAQELKRHGHSDAAAQLVRQGMARQQIIQGDSYTPNGELLIRAGGYQEALRLFEKRLAAAHGGRGYNLRYVAVSLALLGERDSSRAIAATLERMRSPLDHSIVMAWLGELESSLASLRRGQLPLMNVHNWWDFEPLWGYAPYEQFSRGEG